MRKILYSLPVLLVSALIIYLVYGLYAKQTAPSPWVGKEIPEFSLSTQTSRDLTDQSLKGKPCLVTFFASWCFSCRVEHKMLGEISQKYRLPLYGIAYRDDEKAVMTWLAKFGNPFVQIGFDVLGEVGATWGIMGVPETFLLDDQGVVRHHVRGALLNDDAIQGLERAIKTVNKQKSL